MGTLCLEQWKVGFRNPHPVSLDYAESGLELQVYPSYLTSLGDNKKKKKKKTKTQNLKMQPRL